MRPLEGVRILDFFWLGAGPMTSLLLEHLGAEVIKVESQARMDKIREGGPYPVSPDADEAGVFASLNYGKKSITLNLGHPDARAIVYNLVKSCHVVTNNFKASTMGRFGLSFDELVKHNSKIVYITMSTMGAEGPNAAYGAYGSHLAAMSGFNLLSGLEGELPVGLGTLFPDFSCNPFHAATAILASLRHVRGTGQGVQIDISQLESTLHLLGPALKLASLDRKQPIRVGNQHPWKAPHGVFRCEGDDEWVAISVGRDAEWRGLLAVIDPEQSSTIQSLTTFLARQREHTAVASVISAWSARFGKWEAAESLLAAGVPAWPVNNLRDQLERDPLMMKEFIQFSLPSGARAIVQSIPIAFGPSDRPDLGRPPILGEHNFEVLTELCGYSADQVAELISSGVLE